MLCKITSHTTSCSRTFLLVYLPIFPTRRHMLIHSHSHWGRTPIYPLGTWWVHGGFWNKIPSMDPPGPFWLHFDYFYNLPPIHPPKYPPGTCWVFSKTSTEPVEGGFDLPTGFILINFTFRPRFTHPNTHRIHFEYFHKVPTQIPADRWAGYIQKVPTKNPVGKFWSNYKQNPWFLSQFTQKCTCQGAIFHFFKFRLLTSQDSHAHSVSHGNPITPLTPFCISTPLRLTHQDEHGQEQERSQLDCGIPELSEDNDNKLVLQDIQTLGIL